MDFYFSSFFEFMLMLGDSGITVISTVFMKLIMGFGFAMNTMKIDR